ncbi:MAG: hypothetical protein WC483_03930 [Candidatus Paceibacterota bacterium]
MQRLLEAALAGNQRRFTEVFRQVAPALDPSRTFSTVSEVANYWKEAAIINSRYVPAVFAHDTRTEEREMENLGRHRRTGEERGYMNTGPSLAASVSSDIIDYGRAHNKSDEEITTAREDAARAMIGVGFSLRDVLAGFGDLAGVGAQSENESESALAFQAMMRDAAVAHSEKMRKDMRDIQDRMNSTTDVQKKRQLEEDYRVLLQEYNRLIGGAMGSMADQFARGGEATETTPSGRSITVDEQRMAEMARDQATLLIRAHMHRPGEYVPVRVRQAQ